MMQPIQTLNQTESKSQNFILIFIYQSIKTQSAVEYKPKKEIPDKKESKIKILLLARSYH